MLAATVTAFNFRGIDSYSIQFEQVKCTLSVSYTVTILNFWGIHSATMRVDPRFRADLLFPVPEAPRS